MEVQERDRQDRKNFGIHAQTMRGDLQLQQQYLDEAADRKLQGDRDYAEQEKKEHRAWMEKEKQRRRKQVLWQLEEKNRADLARREVIEREFRLAQARKAEEKAEMIRVMGSIREDIQKKAETQAANKRANEQTKLFNLAEDEKKRYVSLPRMRDRTHES